MAPRPSCNTAENPVEKQAGIGTLHMRAHTRHPANHARHSTRTHASNAETASLFPRLPCAQPSFYSSRGRPTHPSQAHGNALRILYILHPALHPHFDTQDQHLYNPTIDVLPTHTEPCTTRTDHRSLLHDPDLPLRANIFLTCMIYSSSSSCWRLGTAESPC